VDDLSPWVSSALTALGIFGTLLGVWLARRGKTEDNRRLENQQTFDQIQAVADARKEEITRKDAEIVRLQTLLDTARADVDRVRTSWEERWSRQMKRCREVTAALVDAIAILRLAAGPAVGDVAVNEAMESLHEHNEDDHNEMGG